MSKSKGVSRRQFAKHIGRSHVWVSRLVNEGKIPLNANGQIPLEEGLKAYEESQQVGYDGNRAHGENQRRKAAANRKGEDSPKKIEQKAPKNVTHISEAKKRADSSLASVPGTGGSVDKINAAYNRARLAEKTFQAKMKELEYKEAQGLLIPLADVEKDAQEAAAAVRERLMSMAPRIAPLCEGRTAREIEPIIEDAVNEALQALRRSRFAKG